jgi:UPF0755 protein
MVAGSACVLGIVLAALFFSMTQAPAGMPEAGKLFTVQAGQGASALGAKLEAEGLVRSGQAFRFLAQLRGLSGNIKSGTYRIKAGMSTGEILDLLVSGKQALVRLTVPEGYTLGQVAELFGRGGIMSPEDFLAAAKDPALLSELGIPSPSVEGYLFPDTYFFPKSYPAGDAIRTMVRNFRYHVEASFPEASGLDARALHEKLILASIVEREYRLPEEAPLMASVFYNRLRIGMALQSCATVVYVLTEREGKPHPDVIYDRDLEIKDPFNTYRQRGLPPGPISSPGMTALSAAFRPAASDYLYFRLVDAEAGRHHFSKTLEQHREAAALIVKRTGGK